MVFRSADSHDPAVVLNELGSWDLFQLLTNLANLASLQP